MAPKLVRALSLYDLTLERLHARYGPVLDAKTAAQVLGYSSGHSLVLAVRFKGLPLDLIVPEGRRRLFFSSEQMASFLSETAAQAPES